jgi:hypothetical protein
MGRRNGSARAALPMPRCIRCGRCVKAQHTRELYCQRCARRQQSPNVSEPNAETSTRGDTAAAAASSSTNSHTAP